LRLVLVSWYIRRIVTTAMTACVWACASWSSRGVDSAESVTCCRRTTQRDTQAPGGAFQSRLMDALRTASRQPRPWPREDFCSSGRRRMYISYLWYGRRDEGQLGRWYVCWLHCMVQLFAGAGMGNGSIERCPRSFVIKTETDSKKRQICTDKKTLYIWKFCIVSGKSTLKNLCPVCMQHFFLDKIPKLLTYNMPFTTNRC